MVRERVVLVERVAGIMLIKLEVTRFDEKDWRVLRMVFRWIAGIDSSPMKIEMIKFNT